MSRAWLPKAPRPSPWGACSRDPSGSPSLPDTLAKIHSRAIGYTPCRAHYVTRAARGPLGEQVRPAARRDQVFGLLVPPPALARGREGIATVLPANAGQFPEKGLAFAVSTGLVIPGFPLDPRVQEPNGNKPCWGGPGQQPPPSWEPPGRGREPQADSAWCSCPLSRVGRLWPWCPFLWQRGRPVEGPVPPPLLIPQQQGHWRLPRGPSLQRLRAADRTQPGASCPCWPCPLARLTTHWARDSRHPCLAWR